MPESLQGSPQVPGVGFLKFRFLMGGVVLVHDDIPGLDAFVVSDRGFLLLGLHPGNFPVNRLDFCLVFFLFRLDMCRRHLLITSRALAGQPLHTHYGNV